MILSSLLTTLLLSSSTFARSHSSSSSSSSIQVYLHPAPQHAHAASTPPPTLSAAQAKSVFAHHLGEGVNEDSEVDESAWGHLIGLDLWAGKDASTRPKVVVIDGGVSAQEILPSSLGAPAFYMPHESSTNALLRPYLTQAKHSLDHILDAVPSLRKGFTDIFELAGTKASEILAHELSCLIALADSIPFTHTAKWDAIKISGLKGVEHGSEIWETGRQSVQAGLESMTTPSSPPLLLVVMPKHQPHARSLASPAAALANSSAVCYASNATCAKSTDCYGHGYCAQASVGGKECWKCKCRSGFAGVECEKEDYTVPFVLLVFTVVMLIAVAIGSIALLSSVGETKLPSTLTLAVGPNLKRD